MLVGAHRTIGQIQVLNSCIPAAEGDGDALLLYIGGLLEQAPKLQACHSALRLNPAS